MTSLAARLPFLGRLDLVALASVAALGFAGALAILAGNGNLVLALAPLALTLVVLAVAFQPLRRTLFVVAFLGLTLENPAEAFAMGLWKSPLQPLGALFLTQLKQTLKVNALIFSGLDLMLALIAMVWLVRRMRGSRADGEQVPTASPIVWAAVGCLATIALVWGFGLARGGAFSGSLWQVFRVIYLPTVILLFAAGLRGGRDAPTLGALLIAAAVLRSIAAIYIRALFPDTEKIMPHTTTHADSMLFANAIVLVLAHLYERPGRRSALLALGVLPVVMWGMVANNRRLGWVELLAALLLLFVVTGWSPLKRRLYQGVILSLPLLLTYVAIGWVKPTGIFAPVRTLRSVVDSEADSSTRWRDWENYNLYATLKRDPLLGTGFGHEYDEVVYLPSISGTYDLYRLAPHNSILGMAAYGGMVGFAGLFMPMALGVFLAVRVYRRAIAARDRIAALTVMGAVVTYLLHCYGDMGLGTYTSVFTLGAGLALIGKIAVSTGAWPAPGPAPAGGPR